MSESMLELHIKQYIEAQTGNEVVFSWQGGEPTLMGLEFFQRVVELQKNMPNLISVLKMIYKPMVRYWMKTGAHF
jgi:sulfatase maturation enzyme AslB (radical SAM superfamily)